ncbi:lactosylceramide 4-alpha-galactosyltransferase-like isoform X2 [Hyposmocoma kahamanoa]|nr:lactosylceramide 4-alpha-galactosyltransferase-like isoform X2 [Hyposmocoma kahamanoa]
MSSAATPKFVHKQLLYIIIVVALTANIFLILQKRPTLIFYNAYKDDVECHLQKSFNLPIANNFSFSSLKQIFFHDVSCKSGLNSREACAVESAATNNPNWDINVFFLGPPSDLFLESTVYKLLKKKSNIHFYRVDIVDFVKDTPIENLLPSEIMHINKNWCLESLAGMIKYLALYKYGGIYLDLDVITVKSFDTLPANWVAKQDSEVYGNAAFALSRNGFGRTVAENIIRDFSQNFNPFTWAELSTDVLKRVLQQICNKSSDRMWQLVNIYNQSCTELSVLDPVVFYPIHFNKRMHYFESGTVKFAKTYGHHLWSSLSIGMEAPEKSILAQLAERSCPTTFELFKDSFGS